MYKIKSFFIAVFAVFLFSVIYSNCSILGVDYEEVRYRAGNYHNELIVPGSNLSEKLKWVEQNSKKGGNFIIEVYQNENINSHTFVNSYGNYVTISLQGIGGNRRIYTNDSNYLFQLGRNVTLILNSNITLAGNNQDRGVVNIFEGNLIMNNGAAITGNTGGSGVYISRTTSSGGTFTMNGGIISGNSGGYYGGGVM
ncbi:MAG: hypothetical protein FWC21_05340 [Treponema sp.]|nr:hypothetical protein [Treponema sp.]